MSKIFGIGYSKTGTTSLVAALRALDYQVLAGLHFDWPPQEPFDAIAQEQAAWNFEWLDREYPCSRFICTVRDKEPWARSIGRYLSFKTGHTVTADGQEYDEHMTKVQEYFAGREILYLDICGGEGWEKLCPFLGVPVPNQPFPHSNSFAENVRRKRWRRIKRFVPKRLRERLKPSQGVDV